VSVKTFATLDKETLSAMALATIVQVGWTIASVLPAMALGIVLTTVHILTVEVGSKSVVLGLVMLLAKLFPSAVQTMRFSSGRQWWKTDVVDSLFV